MSKLNIIKGGGGKDQRHDKFRELLMRFGITGDQFYLDQANEMAEREGEIAKRRAGIKQVTKRCDDSDET